MINIAVCDDNPQFASLLAQHLKKLSAYKVPPRVDCRFAPIFGSADEVLEYLKENTLDVLFLDIDMPKMNGFALAKMLCDTHPDTVIIFVSSYEEFVYSSFEYCPFRFLRKAHLTEDFPMLRCMFLFTRCKSMRKASMSYGFCKRRLPLRMHDITMPLPFGQISVRFSMI